MTVRSKRTRTRGGIVELVAEHHRMPLYMKEYIKAWASRFLKLNPDASTAYPLADFTCWRSYRADIFVHKTGVFLQVMYNGDMRLTLGTEHPLGYYMVVDRLAHRIVASVWKKKDPSKPIINHLDGNKRHNCVDNIEWCDNSHNILHAREMGLNLYNKPTSGMKIGGQRKGNSEYFGVFFENGRQKWVGQVRHDNVLYGRRRFDNEEDAAIHYNNVCDLHRITEKPRNNFPKQKIRVLRLGKKAVRMIGEGRHLYMVIE